MDRTLARKLERDDAFKKRVCSLVQSYVSLGQQSLDFYGEEFDTAHDILMGYAPLSKGDLEQLERGHPKRFILPVTSTQITTMTTFIAQMLFGDAQPHKVEGRGPEDETSATHMNQLLRWNDEQQPGYLLGYLWVQDVLTYNRGIRYNSWSPIFDLKVDQVEIVDDDPEGDGQPYLKLHKTRVPGGGYNRLHLVSPYDFFCDPVMPLWRFQDGRFAGHRTLVPWQEFKTRSELPMDDPAYVLPTAVEDLRKRKRGRNNAGAMGTLVPNSSSAGRTQATMSRTAFERNRTTGSPMQEADKNDPGMVETHEVWVRLVPADNELGEGTEPVIYQALIGNNSVVLALNESPLEHDAFPYAVAEGRPSAYYQFAPSWVMMLKPLQDYIDYLKNRRQQNIARTGGNMFIARTDKVNITDFLNPDKDGLIIPVNPGNDGEKLDDIIKQVQVVDQTRDFTKEMQEFVNFSQVVSGVSSQMQGVVEGDATATEFTGATQMGAGRLSSLARMISVQGLVPETRQFVSNFQQFLTEAMTLRFVPSGLDEPSTFQGQRSLQISRDTIQGRFDYSAHDGSLPGTDSRKVAAIARLLELVPVVPQYFMPAAGNIDARALILAGAKSAGLNIENFQFSEQEAATEQAAMAAAPPEAGALPDLEGMTDPAAMPGPGPGRPAIPDMQELPSASPPQIRPQQL